MNAKFVTSESLEWMPHPNPQHRGVFLKTLVDAETNQLSTFNLVKIRPGGEIVPHVHERSAETFLITTGRALCTLGDETLEYGTGHLAYAPAGTLHGLKNIGTEDVCLVATFTPPV